MQKQCNRALVSVTIREHHWGTRRGSAVPSLSWVYFNLVITMLFQVENFLSIITTNRSISHEVALNSTFPETGFVVI